MSGARLDAFAPAAQVAELVAAPEKFAGHTEPWRLGGPNAIREVEVVATDLRGDPSVGGIVLNLRDVTERRRLEAELRQAQKLEVVGRLSSSIAHDFNNVLTVVLGNAKLAQMSADENVDEYLRATEAAAERGTALARQLLALSRPMPVNSRGLDLAAEVGRIQKTLHSVLPSSILVHVTTSPDPVHVRLDDVQVEQVLLNLALNARDAMPSGGHLTIEVSAVTVDGAVGHGGSGLVGAGQWARVRVADTGCGMDADTLARAFEPFFTTKLEGMGTGLGLSTARRIVSEAGGEMSLTSRPGEGTIVTLHFPLLLTETRIAAPARTAEAPRGRGHVLVVDDEEAVCEILRRYLTHVGYEVSLASDGVNALEALDALHWEVDLLLTDLVMPLMTGEELVARVRERRPDLPVLCMSGTPGALGTDDLPWSSERIILKPAPLEAVATRIAEELRRSPVPSFSAASP